MATKGYDESPPRNGTILFYTVLTLFILVIVKYSLDSYFAKVMTAEVEDKVLTRGMEPVKAMRANEKKMLESGSTPMERAMQMLSQRGRSASPMITPKSGMGEDGYGMEEVKGWTKLERKVRPIQRPDTVVPADGTVPADGSAAAPAPAGAAPANPGAAAVNPAPAPAPAPTPANEAAPTGR